MKARIQSRTLSRVALSRIVRLFIFCLSGVLGPHASKKVLAQLRSRLRSRTHESLHTLAASEGLLVLLAASQRIAQVVSAERLGGCVSSTYAVRDTPLRSSHLLQCCPGISHVPIQPEPRRSLGGQVEALLKSSSSASENSSPNSFIRSTAGGNICGRYLGRLGRGSLIWQ